jgi:hypothetical protein
MRESSRRVEGGANLADGAADGAGSGSVSAAPSELYELSLTGPGVMVERTIDGQTAQRVFVAILGRDATGQVGRPIVARDLSRSDAPTESGPSIREFWNAHSTRTIPEKIAATGAYYRLHLGKQSFSKEDIVEGFEAAGEPLPRNLYRDISKSLRASLISPKSGLEGTYYVTAAGLAAIGEPTVG